MVNKPALLLDSHSESVYDAAIAMYISSSMLGMAETFSAIQPNSSSPESDALLIIVFLNVIKATTANG